MTKKADEKSPEATEAPTPKPARVPVAKKGDIVLVRDSGDLVSAAFVTTDSAADGSISAFVFMADGIAGNTNRSNVPAATMDGQDPGWFPRS